MEHKPVDAVQEGTARWMERRDLLGLYGAKAVKAVATEGKGEGTFAARDLSKGEVVLVEKAVASTCDLPLPKYDSYCAQCGGQDVDAAQALQCHCCGIVFCSAACVESSKPWHHTGTLGLCSKDLTGLLHQLSDDLKQAYYAALLSPPQQDEEAAEGEEEEGAMGAEELKVVMEVFTDCILSMKLVATLHGLGAVKEGLGCWTKGLSQQQKEKGEAIIENFVSNISECIAGFDEQVFLEAYDVCVTNSWPGTSARHLFAAHSLLNHACTPNAVCTMLPQAHLCVTTLAPLAASTELCIDYTDGRPPKGLPPDERAQLEAQWGHPCLCSECHPSK